MIKEELITIREQKEDRVALLKEYISKLRNKEKEAREYLLEHKNLINILSHETSNCFYDRAALLALSN